MKITTELRERFDEKWQLDKATGCWLWTGATAGKGYGEIKIPGERRQAYAHRLSYMMHRGAVPKGKHILHRCDTPRCVNPAHLFIGDASVNANDMKAKGRHLYGERNARAKLTPESVRQIRVMRASGVPEQKIANALGVCQSTVHRVANGTRWTHVK
jgi:hypothetical protein